MAYAAALGVDPSTVANANIAFAEPLPPGQCDPWLANFQKILSDGDPNQDGTFVEVPYQSFLPDIVKVRQRMIDNLKMDALQSTRLIEKDGVLQSANQLAIPYEFIAPAAGSITVTATMHFRHLPPEFIRSLAAAQQGLTNVTPSALISDPRSFDRQPRRHRHGHGPHR